MDEKKLALQVETIVKQTPIVDIHTHLYSRDFGKLFLWGIDELLTYHYLIEELFRYVPDLDYTIFWNLSKRSQADLIWEELFIKHSPVSEATRGVVTALNNLGIDVSVKDLNKIRRYYKHTSIARHIDKVFELANVEYVVMTNDPFNKIEQKVWGKSGCADDRFKPALRIDNVILDFPRILENISLQGFKAPSPHLTDQTMDTIKDFLKDWIEKINPVYLAASFPPDFSLDDGSDRARILTDAVLPVASEHNLPFAMMIGVKRGVNPHLRSGGDSVGKADIGLVSKLALEFPSVKFLVTMLSLENQYELCVTARKFKNIVPFGCWWFLNNPSIIRNITTQRLETLGLTFVPQHSDARILDQLIYKWSHSRKIIAQVLAEKYSILAEAGWSVKEEDIKKDVERILGGSMIFQVD
ncbi:MAG: glucuronate isomerase [Planctomycetota bacterium]